MAPSSLFEGDPDICGMFFSSLWSWFLCFLVNLLPDYPLLIWLIPGYPLTSSWLWPQLDLAWSPCLTWLVSRLHFCCWCLLMYDPGLTLGHVCSSICPTMIYLGSSFQTGVHSPPELGCSTYQTCLPGPIWHSHAISAQTTNHCWSCRPSLTIITIDKVHSTSATLSLTLQFPTLGVLEPKPQGEASNHFGLFQGMWQ